jgi:hypothetical protein
MTEFREASCHRSTEVHQTIRPSHPDAQLTCLCEPDAGFRRDIAHHCSFGNVLDQNSEILLRAGPRWIQMYRTILVQPKRRAFQARRTKAGITVPRTDKITSKTQSLTIAIFWSSNRLASSEIFTFRLLNERQLLSAMTRSLVPDAITQEICCTSRSV